METSNRIIRAALGGNVKAKCGGSYYFVGESGISLGVDNPASPGYSTYNILAMRILNPAGSGGTGYVDIRVQDMLATIVAGAPSGFQIFDGDAKDCNGEIVDPGVTDSFWLVQPLPTDTSNIPPTGPPGGWCQILDIDNSPPYLNVTGTWQCPALFAIRAADNIQNIEIAVPEDTEVFVSSINAN